MIQNLKVDIIYHLTASDFEMEFNLCGCCRMRLLSDKTSDKKSFIKSLARDVARSRVIIACGPLFGDEGLISTVATAIGNGTALCDNKTYNINSTDPIHIINGSTPLVTPDGYFGGCIIESGPQTIILLTENKTFRKNIMQNLIHPYIEDICYIPTTANNVVEAIKPIPQEQPVSQQEPYITESEDYVDDDLDAPAATLDEHNVEFVMDGEDTDNVTDPQQDDDLPLFDENYNLLFTETETKEEQKERFLNSYTPSESDNMFLSEREIDESEKSHKKRNSILAMDISIIILFLLLSLAILSLIYLIILRPVTMGVSISSYIKEIFGISSTLV